MSTLALASQSISDPSRVSGNMPPAVDVEMAERRDRPDIQSISEEVPESESSFTDSSSALFSLYLSHAEKHDREQAEGWNAGADGILVFTGLFAAALATFVIDSYRSLLPDSAGNTVILLAQISQQLDGIANGTLASRPSSSPLALSTDGWRPPASAVWVNTLWFLSLVISLFCALLATLQQRWARRHIRVTQPQLAIHKRALIRTFFAEGATRFHLAVTVEAIPALLHVSVFLFLAGLVVSLHKIHHTVAYVVLAAIVACATIYVAITVLPVVYQDSPYTSPFSTPLWCTFRKTTLALFWASDQITDFVGKRMGFVRPRTGSPQADNTSPFKDRLSRNMIRAAQYVALTQDKGMVARALGWTLDRLDEEGDLVQFAAGIPGFSQSTKVGDAVLILEEAPSRSKLHHSLYRHITSLLIRSAKPGFLPDSKILSKAVREERIRICLKALYFLPHAIEKILCRAANELDNKKVVVAFAPLLKSVDSWLFAERLSEPKRGIHEDVTIAAQCVAAVLATQKPEQQAKPFIMRQLKIDQGDTLDRCISHGHNLHLKNLNNLLGNTALQYIEMDPTKFTIVVSAVRLVLRRLKIEKAEQELRDEYQTLRERVTLHATASSSASLGNANRNATELLSVLPICPLDPQAPAPAQDPQIGLSTPPLAGTATAPARPTVTHRAPTLQSLWPVSQQHSSDAYISMAPSTSYQSSPYTDT